ncbi:MAG: dihydrolipoyl dehydrogenase [Deltaproteobacteria bacterium]|nr:dihydrolipoyl dehydrogenase [Deltaproteobacteria bacterium]
MTENLNADVVVLGGGPGGYAAAFYAADLGMDVTLVDLESNPGGVCLYKGCIPSKALLHAAKLIEESKEAHKIGLEFSEPAVNLEKLRSWKDDVVSKLTGGLGQLAKARKVKFVQGRGSFEDSNTLKVITSAGETKKISFKNIIVATGSRPATLPGVDLESARLWDSTDALRLSQIPKKLLVVGGGYIGLELGSVYAALGSETTVVEFQDGIIPGADRDLATVLQKKLKSKFHQFLFKTKVTGIAEEKNGLRVSMEGPDGSTEEVYDYVLVAIGRRPNGSGLGLDNAGVELNERGFIKVQDNRQTNVNHIYAIGDVAGDPMLAHKASHEARVAVEAIAGHRVAFEPKAIPAVIFTDPEVAWCGLTETEAKAQGKEVQVVKFPWAASGRALTLDRTEGVTKLIVDPKTEMILGAALVGPGAGDMISECALAIEMCATVSDLKLTIHPHPTLSETVMEAAELFFGHCTHMYRPQRKK